MTGRCSHVRLAEGLKKATHLHYKNDDDAPKQHTAKLRKVERRRTGTGKNSNTIPRYPKVTVKRYFTDDSACVYRWVICINDLPTYYRIHKEDAERDAAGIRENLKKGKGA